MPQMLCRLLFLLLLTSCASEQGKQQVLPASAPAANRASAAEFDLQAGATLYQHCAACHLPSGEGVPGAFPPLAGRMAAIAANEQGRRYLVSVVNQGLSGAIKIDGNVYSGYMQGFQSSLGAGEISDVLNYLVLGLSSSSADGFVPFTVGEVASLGESIIASGRSSNELRQSISELN